MTGMDGQQLQRRLLRLWAPRCVEAGCQERPVVVEVGKSAPWI